MRIAAPAVNHRSVAASILLFLQQYTSRRLTDSVHDGVDDALRSLPLRLSHALDRFVEPACPYRALQVK